MKTIKLYGALGKKFGKTHKLDVKNPAEAIRAFSVILKGFKEYMIADIDSGYKIFVGSEDIYSLDIHNPTSDRDIIRIVPIISGSGSGKASMVAGFALIIIASIASGGAAGVAASTSTSLLSWSTVTQLGVILAVSGISSLMFEQNTQQNENSVNNPNYNFDGVVNTTRQGNAVPVGYGLLRIGSQVISAGLTTE